MLSILGNLATALVEYAKFRRGNKIERLEGKLKQVCPHKRVNSKESVDSMLSNLSETHHYCTFCNKSFYLTSEVNRSEFHKILDLPESDQEVRLNQRRYDKAKKIKARLERMGKFQ